MSKRHQSSRRKAYGRRQHEVRERVDRRQPGEPDELAVDAYDVAPGYEEFLFGLGISGRRLGVVLHD